MEEIVAGFLVCCLTLHLGENLWNLVKTRRNRQKQQLPSKTEPPQSPTFALAAIGTMLFWLESFLYPILVFSGLSFLFNSFPLQLRFPYDSWVQIFGMILTAIGYFLFSWSVIARERYAVSWGMTEHHRLVTWGPYRYVRHPSYLAYFLIILGLLFMLLNFLAAPSLIAVPGYFQVADEEEKMLMKRFGEQYQRYQRKTGRFWPRRPRASKNR
ncbi:MAG: methyltransferase family protein [Candidatus Bathyarchaeia archaeon]